MQMYLFEALIKISLRMVKLSFATVQLAMQTSASSKRPVVSCLYNCGREYLQSISSLFLALLPVSDGLGTAQLYFCRYSRPVPAYH